METPEGVRLVLRVAGPVPRAIAFLVDSSVRALAYVAAMIAAATLVSELAMPLLALFMFASEWFYPVLFEVLADGQTIGKRAVGLRVVHDDGTRIRWTASLLRNLLLAADFLPGTCTVGLTSMCVTREFRRLGDLAAGTLVIHTARPAARAPALAARSPLAPPFALALEEQRALVAFAERAGALSESRGAELAALVTPLHGAGEAPRERLLRIAAWLRGGAAQP